jgi:hypothetical protein
VILSGGIVTDGWGLVIDVTSTFNWVAARETPLTVSVTVPDTTYVVAGCDGCERTAGQLQERARTLHCTCLPSSAESNQRLTSVSWLLLDAHSSP